MKDFLKNLFSHKEVSTEQIYDVQCKLSMLMSDGSRTETVPINMKIHAKNKEEAKQKMNRYVLDRTTVAMMSIK